MQIEVRYDGWPSPSYPHDVILFEEDRIAPVNTYTQVVKCLADWDGFPRWPAFVFLRAPATKDAATDLRNEDKVFVDFADDILHGQRSWYVKNKNDSIKSNIIRSLQSLAKIGHNSRLTTNFPTKQDPITSAQF